MDRMAHAYYLLMVVEKASGHPQLKALVDEAMAGLNDLIKSAPAASPTTAPKTPYIPDANPVQPQKDF